MEKLTMHCTFCREGIPTRLEAWRSSSGRFYCSEFCADIETTIEASAIIPAQPTQTQPETGLPLRS
jgi:hypothetical protein